ncbi:MAG: hypothetical protein LBG90_03580 [Spirochaetaceae bacterium]|jgi:hypothetical protein|nr:hypothetical protein [Spirochaetaceae bacterium]
MARTRLLTYRQLHALIQESAKEHSLRMKQADEEHSLRMKQADDEHSLRMKQTHEEFVQWRKDIAAEYERQRLEREAKLEQERQEWQAREAKLEQERQAKLEQERQEWQAREAKLEQERQARKEELLQWQKDMHKRIGQIGRTAGAVVEEIIASRLWEKFSDFSYGFENAFQYVPVYDTRNKKTLTDIDILLFGDTHAMAVEVKSHLELEDVHFHIWRMGKVKEFPPAQAQGRILLGAVGGANIDDDARHRAQELGFFVIELSGYVVRLADRPPEFRPKIW